MSLSMEVYISDDEESAAVMVEVDGVRNGRLLTDDEAARLGAWIESLDLGAS